MPVTDIINNLVSRLPQHPVSDRMRVVIQETLGVAEGFETQRRELESKGHLTPRGRREALKDALTKRFARDLRDAQKPIAEERERLRTMKAAVKVKPAADPNNVVAALERQELRATIAEMPDAERIGFVLGTSDSRIIEAVLGQPAVVSGIPEEVFSKVEATYQERAFAKELEEIRALEAVVAEAQAAATVARDEMRQTIGLNRKEFDDIVVPIEQKRAAPWLINGGGESQTLVVMVLPDGTASYRPQQPTSSAMASTTRTTRSTRPRKRRRDYQRVRLRNAVHTTKKITAMMIADPATTKSRARVGSRSTGSFMTTSPHCPAPAARVNKPWECQSRSTCGLG